ncbi:MAG: hypothetical protein KDD44_02570 [Bdellovibrionales bacterium]|nr:hypothetical protein [Bdellovibrionales bacterium]
MQIVFDFDGVLINSVREVAISAWNAVSSEKRFHLEDLPEHYLKLFLRHRHHVQPAGDFLPFASWCKSQSASEGAALPDLTPQEFAEVVAGDSRPRHARTRLFFASRRELMAHDLGYWLSLHMPYQPLWNTLREHPPARFVIVTNKNRSAVLELCSHFSLDTSSLELFSGDDGASKTANLAAALQNASQMSSLFLDDSINNLKELADAKLPNVELCLADWGYVGPEDISRAGSLGLAVRNQDEICKLLRHPE